MCLTAPLALSQTKMMGLNSMPTNLVPNLEQANKMLGQWVAVHKAATNAASEHRALSRFARQGFYSVLTAAR